MRTRFTALALSAFCTVASLAIAAAEAPPTPGAPKDFKLPAKAARTLDNGMELTFIEFGELPKVTISVVSRVGNLNEGKQTWLADMTGEMLKEGAGGLSSAQIAERAASMGGSVGVAVGPDETTVAMDVLTENGPKAVALIADLLRRPTLPESEFERISRNFQRQLALSKTRPQTLASQQFLATLFPDHAYGRLLPTEELLRSYTIADVRRFHTENFGAARARVYVAGRFDRPAMEAALVTAFGDWARGPEAVIAPPQAQAQAKLLLVDRPGAPQSTLMIGLPTPDPSSPEYMSLSLMNTLLGGSFTSRITTNIRESKGYAYSPGSSLSARYRTNYWAESADVTTEATAPAIKEIIGEIERLRKEAPGAAELRGFQNYRAGVFVIQNSTRSALITQLAFIDLHGLPDEYLTKFVERVYALTPEQVAAAARSYIDPAKLTIVVVGDLAKVRPQLEKDPALKKLL